LLAGCSTAGCTFDWRTATISVLKNATLFIEALVTNALWFPCAGKPIDEDLIAAALPTENSPAAATVVSTSSQ
jgi:hypothetical protein